MTLICVLQNGGNPCFGGSNTPLAGSEKTMWEGGIRVPATVKLPKKMLTKRARKEGSEIFNG